MPELAAAVVLDAHDAAYREESAPTYSAVDVVIGAGAAGERALPAGVAGAAGGPAAAPAVRTLAPTRLQERAGWPVLERVDRRGADPRSGMFSEEFVRLARAVLDDADATRSGARWSASTTAPGGARLLACRHCGELARCARCGRPR